VALSRRRRGSCGRGRHLLDWDTAFLLCRIVFEAMAGHSYRELRLERDVHYTGEPGRRLRPVRLGSARAGRCKS
jgi:hypothetical protein